MRILACDTGVNESGMDMLNAVSKALSKSGQYERKVYGTTSVLYAEDFGASGLRPDIADKWLIQSGTPPIADSVERITATKHDEDRAAGLMAGLQIPDGYRLLGRARPLAKVNFSVRYPEAQLSIACDGRLLMIEDKPRLPPLVLRWCRCEPIPLFGRQLPAAHAG